MESQWHITFKGWAVKWNEFIPFSKADKLAPLGTHTQSDTGDPKRVPGEVVDITIQEIKEMSKKLTTMQTEVLFSANRKNVFWLGELPEFVEKCLGRTFVDKSIALQVHYFLNAVLNHYISILRDTSKVAGANCMEQVVRILGGDPKTCFFYKTYGFENVSTISLRRSSDQIYARQKRHQSGYLCETINHFGEMCGFDIILERVRKVGPCLPLDETRDFIRIIDALAEHLEEDFARKYLTSFFDAVFFRLSNLSDEELKLYDRTSAAHELAKKTSVSGIYDAVKKAVNSFVPLSYIFEVAEKFECEYSYRLITCPMLDKQLTGMSLLNQIADKTNARNSMHTNYSAQNVTIISSRYLTADMFVNWLVKERVVEIIFPEKGGMHVAVAQRSAQILSLIASRGKLSKNHMNLIWNFSEQQQNSKEVIGVIEKIIEYLSPELKNFIWLKVKKFPISKNNLNFVKNLILHSYKSNQEDYKYGMGLLFNVMISKIGGEGGPTAIESMSRSDLNSLEDSSFAALGELLLCDFSNIESDPFVWDFIQRCLLVIREGESVVMGLRLLRKLITEVVSDDKGKSLTAFCEKESLCDIIVEELGSYMSRVNSIFKDKTGDKMILMVGNKFTHREHLTQRFDFLSFISSSLTLKHVVSLFNYLMDHGNSESDKDMLFKWLESSIDSFSFSYGATSSEGLSYLFNSLLCNASHIKVTPSTPASLFSCFQKFFISCNRSRGTLNYYVIPEKFVVVDYFNLLGMDALLDIYCNNTNTAIASAASIFYIHLHTRLASSTQDKAVIWTEEFVCRCMDRLIAGVNILRNESSHSREKIEGETIICELIVDRFVIIYY